MENKEKKQKKGENKIKQSPLFMILTPTLYEQDG